jgi:hypothetical protein
VASAGIVVELQQDCLNDSVSINTILRKAKVIAVKLELNELSEWIDSEQNGYNCSRSDLPPHRIGKGAPKFNNPYNGWRPLITDGGWIAEVITSVHLFQPISELEKLLSGSDNGMLVMYYDDKIQAFLHEQLPAPMECAAHFPDTIIVSALDFVRNKILGWTLELEKRGVLGQGHSFDKTDKKEAAVVTNHIYGGNIGVLGNVAGDAKASKFVSTIGVDDGALRNFINEARSAMPGLPPEISAQARPILETLDADISANRSEGVIKKSLSSLKSVLEGAGGNLVANALLVAMGFAPMPPT